MGVARACEMLAHSPPAKKYLSSCSTVDSAASNPGPKPRTTSDAVSDAAASAAPPTPGANALATALASGGITIIRGPAAEVRGVRWRGGRRRGVFSGSGARVLVRPSSMSSAATRMSVQSASSGRMEKGSSICMPISSTPNRKRAMMSEVGNVTQ